MNVRVYGRTHRPHTRVGAVDGWSATPTCMVNRLIQLTQGVDSSVIDPKSVFGNLPG